MVFPSPVSMPVFALLLECPAIPPVQTPPKFLFTWLAFTYLSILDLMPLLWKNVLFPHQNYIFIGMFICLKYVSPLSRTLKCKRLESVSFTNLYPGPTTAPDVSSLHGLILVSFLTTVWTSTIKTSGSRSLQDQPERKETREIRNQETQKPWVDGTDLVWLGAGGS